MIKLFTSTFMHSNIQIHKQPSYPNSFTLHSSFLPHSLIWYSPLIPPSFTHSPTLIQPLPSTHPPPSFIYSQSLTLTYSPRHSITHSIADTHSTIQSLPQSPSHSTIQSLTHPRSLRHSVTYSFTHTHSDIQSLAHHPHSLSHSDTYSHPSTHPPQLIHPH